MEESEEKSAHERKEVVVIVTGSLYTCQSDLFQASVGKKEILKGKKKKTENVWMRAGQLRSARAHARSRQHRK